MTTNYSYRFYSYLQPVYITRSKTEILHKALRSSVCPQLEDFMPLNERLRNNREALERVKGDLMIAGLYCLYDGEILLSVAEIFKNKITRIVTMPKFRRQGHAIRLITHIKEEFQRANISLVFCPVDPIAEPLFERMGWVRCGRQVAPDGTMDYCPPECVDRYGDIQGRRTFDATDWVRHLFSIQCV